MAIQPINVGAAANDGTGDHARAAFQKVNANEQYLLGLINALSAGNAEIREINFGSGAITITAGANTTGPEIAQHINTVGFSIALGEIVIFSLLVKRTIGGTVYWVRQKYYFKRNNLPGTWGTTDPETPGVTHRGTIVYTDLILTYETIQVEAPSEPTAVYINLGDIGVNSIEAIVNTFVGTFEAFPALTANQLQDDGSIYYFACRQSNEDRIYQYVGALPITIGSGGDTTIFSDYDLVSSSNAETAPPQVQSDWNVVDEESPAFIKNKPTIPGPDTTSESLSITGSYELNANTMPDTLRATLTGNSNFTFAGTPPVGEVIVKNVVLETSTFSLGLPAGTFLGGEVVEGRNVFTFHFMNNTTSGLEVDVFVNLTTVI